MLSNKDIEKIEESKKNFRVYCPYCGHTNTIVTVDRKLCNWCKRYIYKDKKTEFKYKTLEVMKKRGK